MINRWEQGRTVIEDLLQSGQLERVMASRELADEILGEARNHLESARKLAGDDTAGAFQMAYDAARKSLAAVLANQGLRAKGQGAHATLFEAVHAQLHPPLGDTLKSFNWMRPLRNDTEYRSLDRPTATSADVEDATEAAEKIIAVAAKVLSEMPVY